jgi:integrase
MTKRKDGRYQETIYIDGKRKYIYGNTKAEVTKKMRKYLLDLNAAVTFGSVAEQWQEIHREEIGDKTWMNYAPHYKDIVEKHGSTPVDEITALDVITDLKRCAARRCSATIISTRRSIYRMILDHALISGHITHNPAIGISLPRTIEKTRREAPSENSLKIILDNADKPFGLFPALLACTGLRKAEALALTWGDIGEDSISVTKALDYAVHAHPVVKPPKTKAGKRTVPIIDVLKPLLVRPRNARNDDLLFPSSPNPQEGRDGGGYMSEREYEVKWKKYCEAVGFVDEDGNKTLTAHQLRHGLATIGFEAGVDEKSMQKILGHASPTTTREIYTHLREQKLASSVNALNEGVSKMLNI